MISDLLTSTAVIHRSHTINDDGIQADCGAFWRRGDEPVMAVTSQDADVTCERCKAVRGAARQQFDGTKR